MALASAKPDAKWETFYSSEKSAQWNDPEGSSQGTSPRLPVPSQLAWGFPSLTAHCTELSHLPPLWSPEELFDTDRLYSI